LLKGKSYKKINKFIKKDQKYSSLIKQLQAALSKEYNKWLKSVNYNKIFFKILLFNEFSLTKLINERVIIERLKWLLNSLNIWNYNGIFDYKIVDISNSKILFLKRIKSRFDITLEEELKGRIERRYTEEEKYLIDWARRHSQGLDTFKPKYAIADILITKYYLIEFNYVISKEFFSKKKK